MNNWNDSQVFCLESYSDMIVASRIPKPPGSDRIVLILIIAEKSLDN